MNMQNLETRRLPRWLSLRCLFRAGLINAAATRGKPANIPQNPKARGLERRGTLQWK